MPDLTPDEWATLCDPWASAIMADETDRTAALVAADWFDETVPEYLAGNAYQFRADAGIRCAANSHTLLDMLGNRAVCPHCRPPLRHLECVLCGSRRHVRKTAAPGASWQVPVVALAAFAPGNRVWQNWRIGVCGHPTMTAHGWGSPVRFKEEIVIDFGPTRDFQTTEDARGGRCHGILVARRHFDPVTDLSAFLATLRGPSADTNSPWMSDDGRLDAFTVNTTFVTDPAGRVAGRHGHHHMLLTRTQCGPVGFQFDTDWGA